MFILFSEELYKVIKSFGFKIALIGILCLSLFYIVDEYRYFPQYNSLYCEIEEEYAKKISQTKEFLENPTADAFYKKHPEYLEVDIKNNEHYLEFYTAHEPLYLKKDLSQGLSRSIFNYEEFMSLILLFCSSIVCYEKSKGITAFQFSSRVSRGELYFSKFLALSAAVTIIFIVNLLAAYISSGILMGFSDLSGPIQALREYSFAPIERSIKELLVLKAFLGWLICISAVVIFLFISTVTKDVFNSYVISLVLILMDNPLYFAGKYLENIIIATYQAYERYIYGLIDDDIRITVLNMMVQTVCIYLAGLYLYNRIEH